MEESADDCIKKPPRWVQWHVPVIPRSGGLQPQPAWAKKFVRPPSQCKKLGVVVCAYHLSCSGKPKIGRLLSRPAWAKNETLSQKYPEQKELEVWLKH
jgi:hypothetical protein